MGVFFKFTSQGKFLFCRNPTIDPEFILKTKYEVRRSLHIVNNFSNLILLTLIDSISLLILS